MVRLTESLQAPILERLERSPATLNELAKAVDANYYTTRSAVQLLMADGLVTTAGLSARNGKYMLTKSAANNNSIPMVFNGQQNHKMFLLMKLRHSDDFAASTAVYNIPRHIARIFMAAFRLSRNEPQGDTLQRIQEAMRNDLARLQAAVKIYEAVLNNPKNWTESMLLRYTEDLTFDVDEVQDAYAHYFRTE